MLLIRACHAFLAASALVLGFVHRKRVLANEVHYREDCFKLAIRFRHSVIALLNSDHSWGLKPASVAILSCIGLPKSVFDEVEWIQALAV